MFDIDFKPTFMAEVAVRIPSGASHLEQIFMATFEALDIPELEAFDLATPAGAQAFCERVFVGASDLVSGGKPIGFSAEVRDTIIGKSWARSALVDAYLAGLRKAAAGN